MADGLLRTATVAAILPSVCLVGPLPPPSGGMANQCEQLARLLRSEGVSVELVRTNPPYRPGWVTHLPFVRAIFRLIPYLCQLWQAVGRSDVVHVMANSGWAWHLFAAPALAIAHRRGRASVVNYRGGLADSFLSRSPRVREQLRRAALCITPSVFLQRVFRHHGLTTEVIPNIIDLARFCPSERREFGAAPHVVVTRNLEPIYDIPTALRAFATVRSSFPEARLTVAGSGPELQRLQTLAAGLGLSAAVNFTGRIDNDQLPKLYAQADCMLNPSTADNMPISILEALASGVPVVSTDAGGIPDLVTHEQTALLVPVGDPDALAVQALRVLQDRAMATQLRKQGLAHVQQFAWRKVHVQWMDVYRRATSLRRPT